MKLIYVLGLKTGRWPECHMPDWAQKLPRGELQQELLQYVGRVVSRYMRSRAIAYWQLENEPFFKFGKCPSWYYQSDELLRSEVALVKARDPSRKIIISDSGERSNWQQAAGIGDIVGTTMYRTHVKRRGIRSYSFLDSSFYSEKADTIRTQFGKEVICIELQSMNPGMFREGVEFAASTGLKAFYFWGAEWWFWMKETQGQPEIWNEARQLFRK